MAWEVECLGVGFMVVYGGFIMRLLGGTVCLELVRISFIFCFWFCSFIIVLYW